MLSQFFYAQWKYPSKKNEWTMKVREDLKDLSIEENLEKIKKTSKYSFKTMVKKKIVEEAFNSLMERKAKHKKMANLQYSELVMQEYLKEKFISPVQAKIIFRFRTRMEKFSENFKGGKPTKQCPLCMASKDTQNHSFQCQVLLKNIEMAGTPEDIYNQTISKETAKTIENIVKFRETYL